MTLPLHFFTLKNIKQNLVSFLVLFLFLWVTFLPLWGKLDIYPNFFVLIYFHWLLYRPDLITLFHLIGLSLIRDGLLNCWIGVSFLHFLVLYFIIYVQRQFFVHRSFLFVLCAAVGFVTVDSFLSWSFLCYEQGYWVSVQSFAWGALVVFCFYPLSALISFFVQKRYLPTP